MIENVIDDVVDICAKAIDAATDAHPELSANAIRMTVVNVLAASIIKGVAETNIAQATIGQVVEQHTTNVINLIANAMAAEQKLQ